MALYKVLLAFLLIFSFAYAHGIAEVRFVNGYIVEFHKTDISFEFSLIDEAGNMVDVLPMYEIYQDGKFIQKSVVFQNVEIYHNMKPGRYEVRPIYELNGRMIAARFDYEKQGSFIDQIISFILALFVKKKSTDIHEHADFALYINGEKINFSQEKYMENSGRPMSELVHLHDMNGNVIHKHAVGVNLGHFLGTLGISFNSTCISAENKTYCRPVRMYVNSKENTELGKYEFQDLDRILIAVGNYTQEEVANMISSVSDEACIQSKKCPERGIPLEEDSCSLGKCE